jgi:hypothetical protein
MLVTRLTIAAAVLCCAGTLSAQQRSHTEADSARTLVQRFYNWYVPRAANPRGRDMIMEAATHGPLRFDPELVRWLRIDSTARARAKDEIDGLDGDPYLNAQDPCYAYSAQSVAAAGRAFRVSVLGRGGCAVHKRADVVVEIGHRAGRWTILEFRDPSRRNEGTIPLLKQLHPKAK